VSYGHILSFECEYINCLFFLLHNISVKCIYTAFNNVGRFSKTTRRKEVTPAMHEWAMKSVHRCLICLGDIGKTLYFVYICKIDSKVER
jgi:hypothetical protein